MKRIIIMKYKEYTENKNISFNKQELIKLLHVQYINLQVLVNIV